MGIDSDIVEALRTQYAPSCVMPPDNQTVFFISEQYVTLVDLLIYFNSYRPDETVSGVQLYQKVASIWKRELKGNCMHVVIMCDDNKYVPAEKISTQKKRNASRGNILPYGKNCTLNAQGINDPDDPSFGEDEYQPIFMIRLMASRHMRRRMCDFLKDMMCEDLLPADGRSLIFEYDGSTGPWLMRCGKPAKILTKLAHEHGEADLSFPFWYNYFHMYSIKCLTEDSDIIPITHAFLQSAKSIKKPHKIYWFRWRKAKGSGGREVWDLTKLSEVLNSSLSPFRLKQFLLLCFLLQNDYVEKKWLFHFFGIDALTKTIQSIPEEQIDMFLHPDTGDEWRKAFMIQLIRTGYSIKLKKGKVVTAQLKASIVLEYEEAGPSQKRKSSSSSKHKPKRAKFEEILLTESQIKLCLSNQKQMVYPTESGIATAQRMIRWNFQYWRTKWVCNLQNVDPEEEIAHSSSSSDKAIVIDDESKNNTSSTGSSESSDEGESEYVFV